MLLIDTHCHLDREEFDADREAVLERARDAEVGWIAVGADLASSRRAVDLAAGRPEGRAAVGIHPVDANTADPADLEALAALARAHPGVVAAIGETGLDRYWKPFDPARQERFLLAHLDLARELDLPVLLHARDAAGPMLDAVAPFCRAGGRAVWHCFCGPARDLPALLDRAVGLGLRLGVGGMATFEDQPALRACIARIPDRLLLLETDSPFLAPRGGTPPDPARPKRNEPCRLRRVAEAVAGLRGISAEDAARISTRNACELFRLPLPAPLDRPALVYAIRRSLYINLTSACNCRCAFCWRLKNDFLVRGHDLRLEREPEAAEVIAAMGDLSAWEEVVFCGLGEPTLRLDTLLAVAAVAKRAGRRVRLNTNGLASLQHGRDVAPALAGLVDEVSVSLNTADPAAYEALCRPLLPGAHAALGDFVRRCLACGIRAVCTVVAAPGIDVEAARALAAAWGAGFRVRPVADAG